MKAFFLLTAIVGLALITIGCAEPTTSQPAAEGDTPPAAAEHEVMKPVIEEPAEKAETSKGETTSPAAEAPTDAQPKGEADEPPAEGSAPEPGTTEPAKETPESEPK